MDPDFDLDTPSKVKPKKGRRARTKESKDTLEAAVEAPPSDKPKDVPTRPSRRQTGWDTSHAAPSDDIFDSRLLQTDDDKLSDEEDLQVIPDLDEIHDDDITQEIAAPPTILTKNMATYRELDVELMNRSAFRTLDGNIDLKVLVKNLSSEQEVREEKDVDWEWEKLFAEVSTSLKSKQDDAAIIEASVERII